MRIRRWAVNFSALSSPGRHRTESGGDDGHRVAGSVLRIVVSYCNAKECFLFTQETAAGADWIQVDDLVDLCLPRPVCGV